MKLDAHPVTRDTDSSIVVALFYPLRNHTCPPPTTVIGGCIVARMIRGKKISVSCGSPYGGTLTEIRLCRECRLGAVTKPMVAVHCVHGPWGAAANNAQVAAAQRLGAKVQACGFCGKTYQSQIDWSTDSDDLRFCGKRCRQRFHDLSHP